MTQSLVIKFEPGVAEQSNQPDIPGQLDERATIKRVIGFVRAKYVCDLLDCVNLEANPRAAKVNSVVNAILNELPADQGIFQYKTKGILLATSDYEPLDHRRYKITFNESDQEGLLDGGHNMLALGLYFLTCVDEGIIKKIRFWDEMQEAWEKHREEVRAIQDQFDFKLPVEILLPADLKDDANVGRFKDSLFSICAARNNNVELSLWTKENKKGFFAEIRKVMPKEIDDRIEWKSNEWNASGSPISPRDIIALAWIPLTALNKAGRLPKGNAGTKNFDIAPYSIYSSKGKLSLEFDRLMDHLDVAGKPRNGQHELHNTSVNSAFKILAVLPELYDHIFLNMPSAYNSATGGKFGGIGAVKYEAAKGKKFPSPYLRQPSDYGVPDGFIVPVLYGLISLMEVEENGDVVWKTDPKAFLDKHLVELMKILRLAIDFANFDPQKVGKNPGSYELMSNQVDRLYEMSKHQDSSKNPNFESGLSRNPSELLEG